MLDFGAATNISLLHYLDYAVKKGMWKMKRTVELHGMRIQCGMKGFFCSKFL